MGLARSVWSALGRREASRQWTAVSGWRMHYLQAGAGPELILLHGLLGTASSWEPVLPALADQSKIYAIDALGIGESERVPGLDATLQAQASRVIEFMDQAGIGSADFLATSHGGAVALALAARYPERVKNLVLHAPANPFSRLDDPLIRFYLSRIGTWFAHRVPHLPSPMQLRALGRMYGDPSKSRDGGLKKYISSLRIPGTIPYVLSMLKTWDEDMRTLESDLARLRNFPALLIWGELDRAVPVQSGHCLQQYFDDAELVVLRGAGHLPFEECPDMLARAVNDFLIRRRQQGPGPHLVRSHA